MIVMKQIMIMAFIIKKFTFFVNLTEVQVR